MCKSDRNYFSGDYYVTSETSLCSSTTNTRFGIGDRFIPRRKGANLDAARHYLTQGDQEERDNEYVDVFEQVCSISFVFISENNNRFKVNKKSSLNYPNFQTSILEQSQYFLMKWTKNAFPPILKNCLFNLMAPKVH